MSAGRVVNLNDGMGAAYGVPQIRAASRWLGYAKAEAVRYLERSTVERANVRLMDEFGGVRGNAKAMCHLMFGVLTLTADQLMRFVT